MKQKVFYIILVICCLSTFSSAKQTGKECQMNTCCKLKKQDTPKEKGNTDYNFYPLNLCMFSI